MLDSRDALVVLADTIPWDYFNKELERYYSDKGRPANPIRLMVGLLMLKQLKSLSDEELILQVKHNPYYQYFAPDTKPAGFDYIRVTMITLLNFIQFRVTSFIPLAFVTAVVLILMTIGFWSFFSESLEDVLPLFSFFLSCTLLNVVFFSPTPQHAFVSIWVFFIGIIGGLQYLNSLMGVKLHGLLSKFASPPDKKITIVFYIVILFFSLTLKIVY